MRVDRELGKETLVGNKIRRRRRRPGSNKERIVKNTGTRDVGLRLCGCKLFFFPPVNTKIFLFNPTFVRQ